MTCSSQNCCMLNALPPSMDFTIGLDSRTMSRFSELSVSANRLQGAFTMGAFRFVDVPARLPT